MHTNYFHTFFDPRIPGTGGCYARTLTTALSQCNGLKEKVIMAKNVHQLKEKLDKYKNGDRTSRV